MALILANPIRGIKLLFCNLFKAFSLFVNFIPSIDILSVEEVRMGETSTWIKDLLREKFASSSVYSTYNVCYIYSLEARKEFLEELTCASKYWRFPPLISEKSSFLRRRTMKFTIKWLPFFEDLYIG